MSNPDDGDRVVLQREYPVELTPGDGRTIEARIVPYNTVARVADPPHYEPYDEMWLPGAFEKQTGAANRVKVFLNFEHESGLRGIVGHGQELVDREDALYGTFRVHDNADGDKALQLVGEGLLGGVSLEAVPLRSSREDGVVKRVRAHLDKVALCRSPAYKDAQVLAVREEVVRPDPPAGPFLSEEIDRRLEAIRFEPLVTRAVVRKPWDGTPSRFTDDEYQKSCLIDRGGDQPVKERCSLPVLEPNGDVNANALGQAAARLGSVGNVTAQMKAAAARKLMRYYRMAGMTAPPVVTATASR